MKHFVIFLLLPCLAFAGEPVFSITPIGTLPTSVSPNGTTTAHYLITNTTPYTLTDNGLNIQSSSLSITFEVLMIQNKISTIQSTWQVVDLGFVGDLNSVSCNGSYCLMHPQANGLLQY